MNKFFEKQKFPVILLFLGIVLILGGFFEIKDITKLSISPHENPYYLPILLGFLFSILSIILYVFDDITVGWLGKRKIKSVENGVTAELDSTSLNIKFGKLENLSGTTNENAVILPANEFFDDECIKDNKSALGAYVNNRFINQSDSIVELININLQNYDSKDVEKEKGVFQKSYGVGTGVFIKAPLSSSQPVLFVSVTTKRAGEGLRAEMSYIFKAIKTIKRIAVDNRVESVYMPVLGSGHGGLRPEVAIFGMLLAICDSVKSNSGHHIKNFNIVIFQKDSDHKPDIPEKICKRLLRMAMDMYSK